MNIYRPINNGTFSPNSVDYNSLLTRRIKKSQNYLQPVFEAFSNALESIEGEHNSIKIELYHSKSPNVFGENQLEFNSISVIDDGEGFTDENFRRLERLFDESKNKNNLGSGRIQYLHSFKNTYIESLYIENDNLYRRDIDLSKTFFDKNGSPIISKKERIEGSQELMTKVSFFYPLFDEDKEKYNKLSCKELKEIILKRYLDIFCIRRDNLPEIEFNHFINGVLDKKDSFGISLNDIPEIDFEDHFKINYSQLSEKGNSIIKSAKYEEFAIRSYKLPSKILQHNEVRFTSKGEATTQSNVDFSLITGAKRIEDGTSLLVLISSPYLTNRDTDIRGNLNLVTRNDFLTKRNIFSNKKEILVDDIEKETIKSVSTNYPVLQEAKKEGEDNIKRISELFSIDYDLIQKSGVKDSDSDINVLKKVYSFSAAIKAEADTKIKNIIDSLEKLDPNEKSFTLKFNNKVRELNKMVPLSVRNELSQYLSRRALVIELMKKALKGSLEIQRSRSGKKKSKKNKPEGIFHNLLFPQGSKDALESNLWVLNEEYIHFNGLSEQELDKIMIDGSPLMKQNLTDEEKDYKIRNSVNVGLKRPDILLFPEEGKCIIIELKAPKVDVSRHLEQIHRYASIIHHLSDERFKFNSFYGYLIGENADIYSILDADGDFKQSQSLGYVVRPHKDLPVFFGRERGVLYTEVIKFSDLIKRAELRSKVFTDKIIPQSINEKEQDI